MTNKTAILIFANSARKELNSKSIQSAEVFGLLNSETIKTVKKTGLPYFHHSESEQTGNNFAERFQNSIDTVFEKGFETVISVGNDTPHLTSAHILKAKKQLQQNDFVLGPSTDGGYYLMGFKKAEFQKLSFLDLPWETSFLQRSFNSILKRQQNSVAYLETLSDLDDASDVNSILQHFKQLSKSIKSLLLKIQDTSKFIVDVILIFFQIIYFNLYFNKGSPRLLHIS